jgi:hypothetical protein
MEGWRPEEQRGTMDEGSNSCTKAWRPVMPAVPRIRRAVVDEADVYRPAQGIPVVASMEYPASGTKQDVEALAIAWTPDCVEVVWSWRGEQQADWIEARCVKRR